MPDLWMDVDAALAEVPVNLMPLVDDSDFKSIEGGVAYNAGGMALRWHFVTTAGAYTVTTVTPTTGGDYDWTDQGDSGVYTIEMPASGGASINNDTEGFGWFTGVATGVLPWRGPVIGFRAAGLNNLLIDSAYSTTRALAGTALPDAAAGAAGGLGKSTNGIDLDNLPTATYLVQLIALLARKDAAIATDLSAALALINADFGTGAGAYANTTDSQEGLKDLLPAASATEVWTVGNMATAAMKRVADFVLRRNTANAAASTETGLDTLSFRSPIGAVRKLTNAVNTTTNSGKLTVFEEDDTTEAATQTLSTDASAEPITGANTD